MSFADELRQVRQRSFLSQEAFARELDVSFSTVNRWEGGRSKPNLSAMKKLRDFCASHDADFGALENAWLALAREGK